MRKDTLFQNGNSKKNFAFDEQVAEVFDDMVNRSVPLYRTVIEATAQILNQRPGSKLTLYDLGCSTGTTLLELSRLLREHELRLIGIDNAPAMLERARRKAAMFSKSDIISFRKGDISNCPLSDAEVILCNYTLQFTPPATRRKLVERFFEALPEGGLLIISEKVAPQSQFEESFINIYHDFKRRQGYSELEIAAKREALENVLIPFTTEENIAILRQAGFEQVEIFSKWFNFASFVALKSAHPHHPTPES